MGIVTVRIPAPAIPPPTVDVGKYGIFEAELTATGSYGNPYLEMPGDNTSPGFVSATFGHELGTTVKVDGFWDGGDTWRVRFAPHLDGVWTYITTSADSGLDGKMGNFTCVASSSKGWIEVDSSHPHHFRWTDGTPFLYASTAILIAHFSLHGWGANDPPNTWAALGGDLRIDDGGFDGLMTTRQGQGFTTAWWGTMGFCKPMYNASNQDNEGGDVFTGYDEDILNTAYYQYVDLRMNSVASHGMAPMITLGWPDQHIDDFGAERLKRYWRYLIARYSSYNVLWNMFGESDEFVGADLLAGYANYTEVLDDFGALTVAHDPYGHPITTHFTGSTPTALCTRSWMHYLTLQTAVANTHLRLSYNKPILNSEYGGYDESLQATSDELRAMVWGIRCKGAYFVYECWGTDTESNGAIYTSYCNAFFRDRTQFWLLEYLPALFSSTPGVANDGYEYVTYMATGGSLTVDLTNVVGSIDVEWYNPRTGEVTADSPETGGAPRSLTAPDSNDWVLHIGGP